jgi:hypothetical protein
MGNNETRAIRVNVFTTIEELEGRLETIKNYEGLAKGIQVHHVFYSFYLISRRVNESGYWPYHSFVCTLSGTSNAYLRVGVHFRGLEDPWDQAELYAMGSLYIGLL